MTTLDSLPADQRAVLSLLLRQGRSYGQIADTLHISEAAVRERAHGALAMLGPADTDLSARRRAEIGDWLLAQGPEDERAETAGFLDRSESGRAWAGAVAEAVRPIAGDRLPAVPGSEATDDGDAGAAEQPEVAEDAEDAEAAEPVAPAPDTPRPRVSRRGGAVLLGLAALAIAGIAVALLTGGGDDGKGADRAGSTRTASSSDPKVVAQVNLTPPSGAPARDALGILQVVRQNQQQAILVRAQGLPRLPDKKTGYGVWLSSSPSKRVWLGYGNYDASKRQFVATGVVAADVTAYGEVFITRQTGQDPKQPGTIYLRGAVQN
jgi:Sigma-70, region 4